MVRFSMHMYAFFVCISECACYERLNFNKFLIYLNETTHKVRNHMDQQCKYSVVVKYNMKCSTEVFNALLGLLILYFQSKSPLINRLMNDHLLERDA